LYTEEPYVPLSHSSVVLLLRSSFLVYVNVNVEPRIKMCK